MLINKKLLLLLVQTIFLFGSTQNICYSFDDLEYLQAIKVEKSEESFSVSGKVTNVTTVKSYLNSDKNQSFELIDEKENIVLFGVSRKDKNREIINILKNRNSAFSIGQINITKNKVIIFDFSSNTKFTSPQPLSFENTVLYSFTNQNGDTIAEIHSPNSLSDLDQNLWEIYAKDEISNALLILFLASQNLTPTPEANSFFNAQVALGTFVGSATGGFGLYRYFYRNNSEDLKPPVPKPQDHESQNEQPVPTYGPAFFGDLEREYRLLARRLPAMQSFPGEHYGVPGQLLTVPADYDLYFRRLNYFSADVDSRDGEEKELSKNLLFGLATAFYQAKNDNQLFSFFTRASGAIVHGACKRMNIQAMSDYRLYQLNGYKDEIPNRYQDMRTLDDYYYSILEDATKNNNGQDIGPKNIEIECNKNHVGKSLFKNKPFTATMIKDVITFARDQGYL